MSKPDISILAMPITSFVVVSIVITFCFVHKTSLIRVTVGVICGLDIFAQ